MKKTYITPEAVEYKVSSTEMIALSLQDGNSSDNYGDGMNGGDTDVKEEKGTFLWN